MPKKFRIFMVSAVIIAVAVIFGGIALARGIERKLAIVLFSEQSVMVPDQAVDNSQALISGVISDKFVRDEIIVKFKGDTEPFRVMKVPEGKVGEKIKEFKNRADVFYAEPNYIAYALMLPNDPYYHYQWHLDNPVNHGIQTEKAWDTATGTGVTVAVVDTGIRKGTDLAKTCFNPAGYDFVNNDNDPTDDNSHGTHVAGTIAQSTNNSLGVAGVAFGSCLLPVKVLNAKGSGTYANVALGIRYAADNGAKVINLSLGGPDSLTLKEAIAYAYGKEVTIVAAIGNDNKSTAIYPAAYDAYVIAVGATQYDQTKAPYSNYGPSLDLVAPGGNTLVDQNGDGYADGVLQQTFTKKGARISWGYYFFQGTSMAAPHVAGVAALVLSAALTNPAVCDTITFDGKCDPNEVQAKLQATALNLGDANLYGAGLVNAFNAVQP